MRTIIRVIAIIAILVSVSDMYGQRRLSIQRDLERCLDDMGNPIDTCWVLTDSLGRQNYIAHDSLLSILNAGLRNNIYTQDDTLDILSGNRRTVWIESADTLMFRNSHPSATLDRIYLQPNGVMALESGTDPNGSGLHLENLGREWDIRNIGGSLFLRTTDALSQDIYMSNVSSGEYFRFNVSTGQLITTGYVNDDFVESARRLLGVNSSGEYILADWEDAVDSLLENSLRDTISAYGGGDNGLFGAVNNGGTFGVTSASTPAGGLSITYGGGSLNLNASLNSTIIGSNDAVGRQLWITGNGSGTAYIDFNASGDEWLIGRNSANRFDIWNRGDHAVPSFFIEEDAGTLALGLETGGELSAFAYRTGTAFSGGAIHLLGNIADGGFVAMDYAEVADSLEVNGLVGDEDAFVSNYDDLKSYAGASDLVIVTDSITGGQFEKRSTGTADSALVFDAADGNYWHRVVLDGRYHLSWYVNDDTTWTSEIQRAIDTINARSGIRGTGKLYVSPGTWYVDTVGVDPYAGDSDLDYCIELKSNVSIEIDPLATIMLADSMVTYSDSVSRVNIFTADSVQNVKIFGGGTISGNAGEQYHEAGGYYGQATYGDVIALYAPDDAIGTHRDISIEGITICNHSGNPMHAEGVQNLTIRDLKIWGVGEGVLIEHVDNLALNGYVFSDSTGTAAGDGMELVDVRNSSLSNIMGDSMTTGSLLDLANLKNVHLSHIRGQSLRGGIGMYNALDDTTYNVTISDVIFRDASSFGIDVGSNCLISNVKIERCGQGIRTSLLYTEHDGAPGYTYLNNIHIDSADNGILMVDSFKVVANNLHITNSANQAVYCLESTGGASEFHWNSGESLNNNNKTLRISGAADWIPMVRINNVWTNETQTVVLSGSANASDVRYEMIYDTSRLISYSLQLDSLRGDEMALPLGVNAELEVITTSWEALADSLDIGGADGNGLWSVANDNTNIGVTDFNVPADINVDMGTNTWRFTHTSGESPVEVYRAGSAENVNGYQLLDDTQTWLFKKTSGHDFQVVDLTYSVAPFIVQENSIASALQIRTSGEIQMADYGAGNNTGGSAAYVAAWKSNNRMMELDSAALADFIGLQPSQTDTEVSFSINVFDSDEAVVVDDSTKAITIPAHLNGYSLINVIASVHEKGITGTTDVQVRRRRSGTSVDMLSAAVTIGDEWFASDETIDGSNDDVQTGDRIFIHISGVHSGSAPDGLSVVLEFSN